MELSSKQFGLLVAYLLPGFIALGGVALLVPSVAGWLKPVAATGELGLAPPLYAVLGATAVGMILSCFRWLLVDHVLALTGVRQPMLNTAQLEARLSTFNYFVEYHYRYYQFYANSMIAIIWTYALNRWLSTSSLLGPVTDIAVVILCAVLFAGSRDALSKYYARTKQLIG